MEFSWRWLLLQLLCAGAVWLFTDRRGRSAMQRYSDELRRAARELSLQSEQLTSVREAAKESKQESKRRAVELQSLRDRISQLSAQVATLTDERDGARAKATIQQSNVDDLKTRLARSDVRRASLEKELSAASLMRLELLSQLRNDESTRLIALTQLRRSGGIGVAVPPRSPIGGVVGLPVAKSPSESFLTNLQPDLDGDSSDEEIDLKALEEVRLRLEGKMWKGADMPAMELGRAAVGRDEQSGEGYIAGGKGGGVVTHSIMKKEDGGKKGVVGEGADEEEKMAEIFAEEGNLDASEEEGALDAAREEGMVAIIQEEGEGEGEIVDKEDNSEVIQVDDTVDVDELQLGEGADKEEGMAEMFEEEGVPDSVGEEGMATTIQEKGEEEAENVDKEDLLEPAQGEELLESADYGCHTKGKVDNGEVIQVDDAVDVDGLQVGEGADKEEGMAGMFEEGGVPDSAREEGMAATTQKEGDGEGENVDKEGTLEPLQEEEFLEPADYESHSKGKVDNGEVTQVDDAVDVDGVQIVSSTDLVDGRRNVDCGENGTDTAILESEHIDVDGMEGDEGENVKDLNFPRAMVEDDIREGYDASEESSVGVNFFPFLPEELGHLMELEEGRTKGDKDMIETMGVEAEPDDVHTGLVTLEVVAEDEMSGGVEEKAIGWTDTKPVLDEGVESSRLPNMVVKSGKSLEFVEGVELEEEDASKREGGEMTIRGLTASSTVTGEVVEIGKSLTVDEGGKCDVAEGMSAEADGDMDMNIWTKHDGLQECEEHFVEETGELRFTTNVTGSRGLEEVKQQQSLSICRAPWMDSLNPRLQNRLSSTSIGRASVRPISPEIPGVISSTTVMAWRNDES